MKPLIAFIKKETVLCVAFVLAVISAFFVTPDKTYLTYPDWRTLALLFSLMLIVGGLQQLGVFTLLGQALIKKAANLRMLYAVMILLCFFSSMLITNDVALITFVPFTILVFRMIERENRVLKLIVLETIAANLGSMATPIGNPQNLYLYSISAMSLADFARAVWPYTLFSLVLLLLVVRTSANEHLAHRLSTDAKAYEHRVMLKRTLPYLALLLLCLLVVFRILPYGPVLLIVAVVVFATDRNLFLRVDYGLLATFLCFFVFIGNIKRIPAVTTLLTTLLDGRELGIGILVSQIISNVPTAILLSGFTDNLTTLLTAVNLGGLGTLIASLASLISFKFFSKNYPQQKGAFLKIFTFWNLGFLIILTLLATILSV
ncbi:MAG: SLC13 family permease [Peptococcaceae bacterium]|nr:SLC13 family permease [Peptococcaceae bacterium]